MRTDLELRVVHGVGARVRALVENDVDGQEAVVFGFVSFSTPAQAVILREVVPLPEGGYVHGHAGATWDHRVTIEMSREAMRRGTGLVIVHAHGHRGMPRLSATDSISFEELAVALRSLFPTMPFGSIVLSADGHASGRIAFGIGVEFSVGRVRWLGSSIEKLPAPPPHHRGRAKRHDAVWGDAGEGKLRGARLGVIGAGGGGTHEIQQLSHVGIGTIVVVEDQRTDLGNRSRMVGTRPKDVGKRKLVPMKRLVADAGDETLFEAVAERFPSRKAIAALATCDVLLACVDTLHARKNIMEFAWQHAIPLIDIGLTIAPREPGPGVRAIGGHVFIGIPGGRCMWCEGILSEARLAAELDANGYVRGEGGAQVVSLNGLLASQAVTESLNLLTGFWGATELPPARLVFDGRSLFPAAAAPRPCELCSRVGFGDVRWTPVDAAVGGMVAVH